MATARELAISRGPWPDANRDDAFEFMFDDGSKSPFVLHAVAESLDRLPSEADEGRGDLACLAYIGRKEKPVEALALTAWLSSGPAASIDEAIETEISINSSVQGCILAICEKVASSFSSRICATKSPSNSTHNQGRIHLQNYA
jgi:hypothetical protein